MKGGRITNQSVNTARCVLMSGYYFHKMSLDNNEPLNLDNKATLFNETISLFPWKLSRYF